MTTALELITDVRARIVEANADFFADNLSIVTWLNQGYRNFVVKSKCLDKIKGFGVIAGQDEYALPSDYLNSQLMRWEDRYFIRWRDLEEFSRFAGFSDQTSDRPYIYRIFPSQLKFRLFPIPSITSGSTTLSAPITATDTVIPVVSTAAFPSRGRISVGSEQILYYATTATSFTQCIRGDGPSTAAAHLFGEVAQYLPMTMLYNFLPPAMVEGGQDSLLPVEYDEAIIAYATAICFRAKDKYEVASQYNKTYKEILDMAIEEQVSIQRDRLPVIKEDENWDAY